MPTTLRWTRVVLILLVVGVTVGVLLGTGLVAALPRLVGGGAGVKNLEVTQPPAVSYQGPRTNIGYDVSFPQCGTPLPDTPGGFAIIGIHGGRPFKDHDCVEELAWWARQQSGYAVYINLEDLGVGDAAEMGRKIAADAIERMQAVYLPKATPVWLDVETDNVWRGSNERHRALIQAAATELTDAGHPVGVYSAPRLWWEITDGVDPGMPVWFAIGEADRQSAERACTGNGLGGRRPSMVQWIDRLPNGDLMDHDLLCPGVDPTGLLIPASARD